MKRIFLLLCWALPATAGPLEEANLIDIQTLNNLPVFVSLRYATDNNFTGKQIYSSAKCYLHKDAVEGLQKAVKLAMQQTEPFTFCLWDCYRPQDAQQKRWAAKPNPNYVAPPKKGSRHSRGMSIDLSPCDLNGNPLPMPTDFDNFTKRAHMDYMNLPADILKRREVLKQIMTTVGFTYTRTEWWHFDKKGWKNKPLLNVAIQ